MAKEDSIKFMQMAFMPAALKSQVQFLVSPLSALVQKKSKPTPTF